MKKLGILLSVMFISLSIQAQEIKTSEVELILENIKGDPDWSKINQNLVTKYGEITGDSITQNAKVEYYWKKREYPRYINEYIAFVKKYNLIGSASDKNYAAWRVFEYATDPEGLKQAEKWITDAQYEQPENPYFLDTYANILYKSGRTEEALKWQTLAVWITRLNQTFVTNLYKMKTGIPTWKYPEAPQISINVKSAETVWLTLQQELKRTVDSAVWQTRLSVSKAEKNQSHFAHTLMMYVEEFRPHRQSQDLNKDAWTIFEYSSNKAELKKALMWSRKSLKDQTSSARHYAYLDTYANLLFKLGKKKKAIKWQEKALSLCPENEKTKFEATLIKFRNNEKTWMNE